MSVTPPRAAPNLTASFVSGHRNPFAAKIRLSCYHRSRESRSSVGLPSEARIDQVHRAPLDGEPGERVHRLDRRQSKRPSFHFNWHAASDRFPGPLDTGEDEIEPVFEFVTVVVTGLHRAVDGHLGQVRILARPESLHDVFCDLGNFP